MICPLLTHADMQKAMAEVVGERRPAPRHVGTCRSRYLGEARELEITHEVPAERQFIRHAGTMHRGWI